MRTANLCATALLVGLLLPVGSAFGQHGWRQTITVDPNLGAADHQTIQAGINDVKIGNNPTVRFTVLIFAGTYIENVTLGGMKENVDLVGIDRESVIIQPTSAGSGIKITSGTETSRNNLIANLTIVTSNGHGIEIVKGGGGSDKTPKDIVIEDVTIVAVGTAGHGIEGSAADTVRISNCNIDSAGGSGVRVGDNYQIVSSSVSSSATTWAALRMLAKDGLLVTNCTITSADYRGFFCTGSPPPLNIQMVSSEIRGELVGAYVDTSGANVRFRNCYIVAEGNSSSWTYGVYLDHGVSGSDVVFQGCRIDALGDDNTSTDDVRCVQIDNTPDTQFIDCDFRAVSLLDDVQAQVYGISTAGGPVVVIGGSIETSQPDFDRPFDVFDLVGDEPFSTADHIFISGTQFSKWIGPINAAGRPRSVMQRTISVGVADADAILSGIAGTLTPSEQNVTPGDQPDVYRVLSVTGNLFGMKQDVYIVGTDWADNVIVEKITLSDTSTTKGFKPFKTVTNIILPAQTSSGQIVEVGTTNKLGLYYPLSAKVDVIQEARLVSGVYTDQSVGSVDEVYSTVVPSSITNGDSFQWALLTGR